eukprot:3882058-Amphidinium_carterae.1
MSRHPHVHPFTRTSPVANAAHLEEAVLEGGGEGPSLGCWISIRFHGDHNSSTHVNRLVTASQPQHNLGQA